MKILSNDVIAAEKQLSLCAALALEMSAKRCDAAEVAVARRGGISLTTRLSELETLKAHQDDSLTITLYRNHHRGSASTSDLRPEGIRKAIEASLQILAYTSSDLYTSLADRELLAWNPVEIPLFFPVNLELNAAIALTQETEQAALRSEPRISNSEGAEFESSYGVRVYGNSYGMLAAYKSTLYALSCSVIASQEGMMERGYYYSVVRDVSDLSTPIVIGNAAANRALERLGSRTIATCRVPFIAGPRVVRKFLKHLASAIHGNSLYKHASFLEGALGKQLFPEWFAIKELPHLPKGLGSAPFDNDGVRTENRSIIEAGVLQTYLLGTYSARKLKSVSTGHSGGIYNWSIPDALKLPYSDLLKELSTGLVVTDVMGESVNPITGNYSQGAAGFWVENGVIQYPVHEITISGNLRDLFKGLLALGQDVEYCSAIQTGSALFENVQIAG